GLRERLEGDGHAAGEGSLPDIGDLLDAVLDASGYRDALQGSNDPQDGTRLDNLEELVGVAREFSSEAALRRSADEVPDSSSGDDAFDAELDEGLAVPGSLEAFLERVSLVADADEIPEDDAGEVTLMTLHTAKGLEFPAVFLVGWEDGLFPHMRALGDPAELAEERRLAYVGITRARRRLYISRAMLRSTYGQPMTNPPSRFFGEIPDSVVEWEREEPQRSSFIDSDYSAPRRFGQDSGGYGGFGSAGSSGGSRFGGGSSRGIPKAAPKKPALELELGDRVNHDKYGLGKVVGVEGTGTTARARIDFGDYGTVQLMLIGGVPMTKL
ncbi:MAG TPA: ATP-binding domain-containing protein, partial [Dietzia timorensis]